LIFYQFYSNLTTKQLRKKKSEFSFGSLCALKFKFIEKVSVEVQINEFRDTKGYGKYRARNVLEN
jgi:hypothetical protein